MVLSSLLLIISAVSPNSSSPPIITTPSATPRIHKIVMYPRISPLILEEKQTNPPHNHPPDLAPPRPPPTPRPNTHNALHILPHRLDPTPIIPSSPNQHHSITIITQKSYHGHRVLGIHSRIACGEISNKYKE